MMHTNRYYYNCSNAYYYAYYCNYAGNVMMHINGNYYSGKDAYYYAYYCKYAYYLNDAY